MALRIIVRTDDAGMACNVGGAVLTEFKTFLVNAPEVEAYVREVMAPRPGQARYEHRQIIGIEIAED